MRPFGLGVGEDRRVDREDTAVDQRARPESNGLEVGRGRRARVRGVDHAHVVVAAEHQRLARLEVIDRHEDLGDRLAEARVPEVAPQ